MMTEQQMMPTVQDFAKKYFTRRGDPREIDSDEEGWTILPHQLRWINFIEANDRILILAPRGFGKTESLTHIWLMWKLCQDPRISILLASHNEMRARVQSRWILNQIEHNEGLQNDFNIRRGTPWRIGEYYLDSHNQPFLTSLGGTSSMTGWRGSTVLFDDLLSPQNSETEVMRNTIENFVLSDVLPALNPDPEIPSKVIFVGTRKNQLDFYGKLLKNPRYACLVDRARWDDESGRHYLWPERFNEKVLDDLLAEMGSTMFARELLNQAEPSEGGTFKRAWLRYYQAPPPREFTKTYLGIDPGLGMLKDASYFAMVVVAIDVRTKFVYLLDAFRGRMSMAEQRLKIIEWAKKWEPTETYCESVFSYKFFADSLLGAVPNLKKIDYVHDQLSGSSEKSKIGRIETKLGVLFEKGQVFIRDPAHDYYSQILVEEEFIPFPKGTKDILDALTLACNPVHHRTISPQNLGIYTY